MRRRRFFWRRSKRLLKRHFVKKTSSNKRRFFFGIHPQLWNWPRSLNWSICSPELNWPAKIFYRVFLKLNVTRTSFVSKGDISGVFDSGPKSNSFESCPIRFFQQKSFENFALIGGKQMKNTFSVLHLWSTKFKKYFMFGMGLSYKPMGPKTSVNAK